MPMTSEKAKFMKSATLLIDTREQENKHITSKLSELGVAIESRKLDFGDYSFCNAGRDFSGLCVVERKANVLELYNNMTEHKTDKNGAWIDVGERIQKELDAANRTGAQLVLMLEDCGSSDELREYVMPEWQRRACPNLKTYDIGRVVYQNLKSWQTSNRYGFRVEYVKDKQNSAARILEEFYYWYRNYKLAVSARR